MYFNTEPKDMPKLTNPLENDTDSLMMDRCAPQNQNQNEIPCNFTKEEPNENRPHQLPNSAPKLTEANNWPNQEWDNAEWNAWSYFYFWPIAKGYGGNNPSMQKKGREKGGGCN